MVLSWVSNNDRQWQQRKFHFQYKLCFHYRFWIEGKSAHAPPETSDKTRFIISDAYDLWSVFFLNIYSFGYINNIVSVYPSFSFMPYQSGRPIILTINVIKCVLKWSTLSSLFHLIFILNRSIFWLFFLFLSSSVCPKQRT